MENNTFKRILLGYMKRNVYTCKMLVRFLVIILILSACSPQKRLQKLIDKNPDLVQKKDTVFTDTISVKEINYSDSTIIHYDTAWRDTLVFKYGIPKDEANNILNEAVKILDTIEIDTVINFSADSIDAKIRIIAKVFQRNGRLIFNFHVPPTAFTYNRKFSYEKVVYVQDSIWTDIKKYWKWIVIPTIIMVILAIVFKQLKRIGIL